MFHGEGRGCQLPGDSVRVSQVFRTIDYELRSWNTKPYEPVNTQVLDRDCVSTAYGVLNHFELRVSQSRIEIYASNAGDPSSSKIIGSVDDLGLTFSRGYLSLQHAHYNAAKSDPVDGVGVTPVQVYNWDNIGFDGHEEKDIAEHRLRGLLDSRGRSYQEKRSQRPRKTRSVRVKTSVF